MLGRVAGWRPVASQETLALLTSLYFSLMFNGSWWRAFASVTDMDSLHGWTTAAAFFIAITLLQACLLMIPLTHRSTRPVLTLFIVVTAMAAYYMNRYTVYLDADMLRNVLHTEPKEAGELLTAGMFSRLLLTASLPVILLWRVRLVRTGWMRTMLRRCAAMAGAAGIIVLVVGLAFQDVAALMRNHKEMRYLITPGNYVVSLMTVLAGTAKDDGRPRTPVGEDAHSFARAGARPKLLVIVVGETVRAQNWGLNGYARQTTPELAALDVFNFSDVIACGSSTEVSLPCLFSARGRRDYDAADIKHSESLLHVLERAGIRTLWRDNQTGCKGVCDGLAFESFLQADDPDFCDGQRCLDEILLGGLSEKVGEEPRDRVVVLHPLGNHGPSYHSRYPPAFRRFTPACDTSELGDCTQSSIVNAYDNAVLYGDHFLARTIAQLDAMTAFDTAMIYVSDHGESLGEHNLYLHGVPYAIAPAEQLKVPMVWWLSQRWMSSRNVDRSCLRARLSEPASHDNVFSSVLGLMQVRTSAYDPSMDLLSGCTGLATEASF